MKISFTIAVIFLNLFKPYGQNTIGIPDITNYYKSAYNAGTQNRAIVQDKNGIVYFANFDGLLSFDGTYWKLYPVSNKTIVRSIAIGADSKIYAGGQDDFGYFSPDNTGKLVYTSLKSLLSDKNYSFTDIWNIVPYGNSVFFRSREKIFQLKNNSITVFPTSSEWQFLGLSNDHLIAQDLNNGLLEFKNNMWVPFLRESALPPDYLVTCMVPFGKDSSFITTINTGFFILHENRISKFEFHGKNPFLNQRILTAIPISKEWMAVGTNLDGCYIFNKNGEIIQNLSRKEGLQINNVLCLFVDNKNNLWLGLDNGVDFIGNNNAIKHIYPEKLNEGEGYTSLIYKNELYVGTSNGLYRVPLTDKKDLSFVNGEFKPVNNTEGSSWCLAQINGNLLFGHHDGAFQIKNGKAIPINKRTVYYTFLPLSNISPSALVVAGNFIGLDLLKYENNKFTSLGTLPGFAEVSQFVAIDDNNTIWVAHPYRGVYRIDISKPSHPHVKLFNDKKGLPSSLKNHLYKIKNRIAVATEKGIYEYNAKSNSFELSSFFKPIFGHRNIRHLVEDSSGNIWFIEQKNLGMVDFSQQKPQTIYFPELNGKMVSGFEHIYPYNKYNVFVGAEKGFYHINYEEYKSNKTKIEVNIGAVKAMGTRDSILFGGYFGNINEHALQNERAIPDIANTWNSFHFEYSSPLYDQQSNIEYSYYLKGFDKGWSVWSKKTEKDYTNLPPGTFAFFVKAKTNLGNESTVKEYSFTVLPPWYRTNLAYIIYTLLFLAFNYKFYLLLKRIFLRQQQKHERERKQLQYLHQLELEKSENEIIALRNANLEKEIEYKNREIASVAMHLVQKGELLAKIKDELVRLKKESSATDKLFEDFKKLIRILGDENKMDEEWEKFAIHFDKINSDFLKSLKESYQNLSANELKLCAYLLMNLSSKEIAQLLNISVRGVEISRYRLRKKFQIATETNLFDFLLRFSNGKVENNGTYKANGITGDYKNSIDS